MCLWTQTYIMQWNVERLRQKSQWKSAKAVNPKTALPKSIWIIPAAKTNKYMPLRELGLCLVINEVRWPSWENNASHHRADTSKTMHKICREQKGLASILPYQMLEAAQWWRKSQSSTHTHTHTQWWVPLKKYHVRGEIVVQAQENMQASWSASDNNIALWLKS